MPRYFVKQPNGLYAEFSTVVDGFTMYHATREQAVEYVVEEAVKQARIEAEKALTRADDDCPRHLFGAKGEPGSRWRDSLHILKEVHGQESLDKFLAEYEATDPERESK